MRYTEFVLGIILDDDTPEHMIDIIKYMLGARIIISNSFATGHPLFKTGRWDKMFRSYSDTFPIKPHCIYNYNADKKHYTLSVRCAFKNYDSEIELFLNWIAPYVRNEGFVGTMRCEEYEDPYLLYYDSYRDGGGQFYFRTVNGNYRIYLDDDWLKNYAHVVE